MRCRQCRQLRKTDGTYRTRSSVPLIPRKLDGIENMSNCPDSTQGSRRPHLGHSGTSNSPARVSFESTTTLDEVLRTPYNDDDSRDVKSALVRRIERHCICSPPIYFSKVRYRRRLQVDESVVRTWSPHPGAVRKSKPENSRRSTGQQDPF
jgi:hypothetical protein